MPAANHHADRQTVGYAAGNDHRRMPGVRFAWQVLLAMFAAAATLCSIEQSGGGSGGARKGTVGMITTVMAPERRVVGAGQEIAHVLRLGIVAAVVAALQVGAREQVHPHRQRQVLGPRSVGGFRATDF